MAFRAVYDVTFEAVRRFCMRRLPVSDVNDAVSEVYLIAWRRVDRLPEGTDALPWLYGVARNVVRHVERANRRRFRLNAKAMREPVGSAPDPEVVLVRRAEEEQLATAIARLSVNDQEVIRLRSWEDLTAPAMAEVLGCSVSAAEKRITRAFQRLEKLFEPVDPVIVRPIVLPEEGGA
jgi:RNA polymerase sigma-70 factor (ECF subfamily)